ncbi:hypothetical protein LJC18_00970 [Lachnospiraceae bacterium OttesenSCG-928-E19]|nr:hypothetical protein [Lachnospiraceae bacterium OttesenSCG-928-E19]
MYNIKVLKFGGGIFTDQYVMPQMADVITQDLNMGHKLMVVVSAMGKTTRELENKIPTIIDKPNLRERDMLLSNGENIAASLFAMHLIDQGIKARSFTGPQVPIYTDNNYSEANILDIPRKNMDNFFAKNDVAIITGFQGVGKDGDITTLGFNGSDTTAFALMYYFKALSCVLYKDVNGVYDKDPKQNIDAQLYKYINYREVLNGNTSGIIHKKALELCSKIFTQYDPEITIRNINLSQNKFTTICKKQTEFHR